MKQSLLVMALALFAGLTFTSLNAQQASVSYIDTQSSALSVKVKSMALYHNTETPDSIKEKQERRLYSYAPVNYNGKTLVFAGYDSYVQGWDVESGTLVYKDSMVYNEQTGNEWAVVVKVAESKNFLLADYSGDDRLLKVVDLQNFSLYDTVTGYVKYDVSHTDKLVAMMENEESHPVLFLDLKTKARHVLATDNDWSNVLKISPSGNYVVRIKRDSLLEIYDTRSQVLLAKTHVANRTSTFIDVHFTPNEEVFVIEAENSSEMPLFNTRTGKRLHTFRQPQKSIMRKLAMQYVGFDIGGKGIYTSLNDEVYYYDLKGQAAPRLVKVAGSPMQYEKDGSFWFRNRKVSEVLHYSPSSTGELKQIKKYKYTKGYNPYKVTGSYAFLEGSTELIVLAKNAKGKFQPHYAIYSHSPGETSIKRGPAR